MGRMIAEVTEPLPSQRAVSDGVAWNQIMLKKNNNDNNTHVPRPDNYYCDLRAGRDAGNNFNILQTAVSHHHYCND